MLAARLPDRPPDHLLLRGPFARCERARGESTLSCTALRLTRAPPPAAGRHLVEEDETPPRLARTPARVQRISYRPGACSPATVNRRTIRLGGFHQLVTPALVSTACRHVAIDEWYRAASRRTAPDGLKTVRGGALTVPKSA